MRTKEELKEYKRRYYEAHREEILAKQKEWNAANKEYRRDYAQKYKKEHPEKIKAANMKWRKNNPKKVAKYQSKYYYNHVEEERERKSNYYQRKKLREFKNIMDDMTHRNNSALTA